MNMKMSRSFVIAFESPNCEMQYILITDAFILIKVSFNEIFKNTHFCVNNRTAEGFDLFYVTPEILFY